MYCHTHIDDLDFLFYFQNFVKCYKIVIATNTVLFRNVSKLIEKFNFFTFNF